MKYLLLPIALIVVTMLTSCKENVKQTSSQIETVQSTITVISPKEVYDSLQEDQSLQLLDVRTPEEYGVTHLKSSQNICVTTPGFEEKAAKLDKSKPVYVYCKSGGRSARASKILSDMGFTQIYDIQGGITNWQAQDLEVVE
jgi:rhodanese-related sulfurtransferase